MITLLLFISISILPGRAFGEEIRVTVRGGVAHPGTYAVPGGSRLSSLVEKAGGYSGGAWLPGAVITRNSLKDARKATLREIISRVEAEALAAPGEEKSKRAFFESMKMLEPTGKMPAPLTHLRLLKGSAHDLPLEDGDTLVIPAEKPPVTVAGAVRDRGCPSFPHSGEAGYMDYIRMAGGFSEDADADRMYLLKADAAVLLPQKWIRWNPAQSRWEIAPFSENYPRIEPGDTIVVPKKPGTGSWTQNVMNLSDLLMQIAAMTGTAVEAP